MSLRGVKNLNIKELMDATLQFDASFLIRREHFSVEELRHLGTKSGCKVRRCTEQAIKISKDNAGNLSQIEKRDI